MKKYFVIAILLLSFSLCFCHCKQYCNVKYQVDKGWSRYYYKEVTFESGEELNTATGTHNYEPFSNYAIFHSRDGDVTVIKLTTLLVCGRQLDCKCLNTTYTLLDGTGQDNVGWKICLGNNCY